jgi:glycosyltransferase involved in cell wall biosynthesis
LTETRSRPTVSVVIPCYRYGRFLPECVASVLDQEGVDVRVLIIDDASPDGSAEVGARLAAEEDQVEFRRHPVNQGHIATYNEGLLEWADGEYSLLLSADDLLTPGSLARATAVLDDHPRVGFVYGHPLRWDDREPRPAPRTTASGVTVWSGLDWLRIVCRLRHSVIASPEVVVRTSVQHRLGGYRPELPHSGDAEMWMRFAVHADVAFIRGADQAFYRAHGTNMTEERVPVVDLRQRKAAYDAVFDGYPGRIPSVSRVRRQVDRGMAREALWEACRAYDRGLVEARIAELSELAESIFPRTHRLPEAWGLRWRRRAGSRVCASVRPLMFSAARRRAQSRLWWWRWERRGV